MNNLRDRLGSTQRTLTLDHYSETIQNSSFGTIRVPMYYNGELMTSSNGNLIRFQYKSNDSWIYINAGYTTEDGCISIGYRENATIQDRTGTVDITYKGLTVTFTITQAGCYPYVYENVIFLDKEQGSQGTLHILCRTDANDTGKSIRYDELFDGSLQYSENHTNYDVSYDGHGIFTFTAKNTNDTGNQIIEGFRPSSSRGQMDYVYIVQQPQFNTIDGHEYFSIPARFLGNTTGNGQKLAVKFVGQTNPEDAPLYFQYGNTTGYLYQNIKNLSESQLIDMYPYGSYDSTASPDYGYTKYNTQDNLVTLQSSDDPATVIMGGGWRTPTHQEQEGFFLHSGIRGQYASYNGAQGLAMAYHNGSQLDGGFLWLKGFGDLLTNPAYLASSSVWDSGRVDKYYTCDFYDDPTMGRTSYGQDRYRFFPILAIHD